MQTNFTLFLTVFGYFGAFCALWCIFGNSMVILVGTSKRAVVVTVAPRGLGYAHMGPYFTAGSLGDTNMHSLGCLRDLLGSGHPRFPICLSLVGAPKMTVF